MNRGDGDPGPITNEPSSCVLRFRKTSTTVVAGGNVDVFVKGRRGFPVPVEDQVPVEPILAPDLLPSTSVTRQTRRHGHEPTKEKVSTPTPGRPPAETTTSWMHTY